MLENVWNHADIHINRYIIPRTKICKWTISFDCTSSLTKLVHLWQDSFLTFPACFSIPIIFSNFDFNCSNLSSLRNLQEQVKKAFCYQELFWPFTVWINCSSDREKLLKFEAEGQEFAKWMRSLEQFIQTVNGQNNSW